MIQTVPHTCSCWNVWTSRTAELLISVQLFSFKSIFKNSQGLVGVVVGGFSEGNGSKEQAAAFTLLMGATPPRSSPQFDCCWHRATQTAAGVQAAAGKCFRKQTSAFAFCVLIFSRYWNKQRATLPRTQEDLWSISGRRVTPGQACSWRVSGS